MSCDTIIHQLDLVCLDNSSDGFERDNNLLLDNQIGNRSYARQSVENPAFWEGSYVDSGFEMPSS